MAREFDSLDCRRDQIVQKEKMMPYIVNGRLHRTDGPAIELPDGTRQWWNNGQLHRPDGPAVEKPDGHREWWFDGRLHNTSDRPAIERANGTREWWYLGRLNRVYGPAIEFADGGREWWKDDQLHRSDGPAVEWADGTEYYCLHNRSFRVNDPYRVTPNKDSVIKKTCGYKAWWFDGMRHRLDGPAVEESNVTYEITLVDVDRRVYVDGPSVEWWVNDMRVDRDTVDGMMRAIDNDRF